MLTFALFRCTGTRLEVGDYQAGLLLGDQVDDAVERDAEVFAGGGIDQRGGDRRLSGYDLLFDLMVAVGVLTGQRYRLRFQLRKLCSSKFTGSSFSWSDQAASTQSLSSSPANRSPSCRWR